MLGLLGGIGLAPALDQLFKAFGADLPDSGTVLESRTIVVSLLAGIGVTVLAGLLPGAARHARAADRGDARGRRRSRRGRCRPRRTLIDRASCSGWW